MGSCWRTAQYLEPCDLVAPLLAIDARVLGTDTTRSLWARLKQRYRQIEGSLFGAYRGAAHHTLFMLGITHDDSRGRMSLVDNRLRIDWPGLGEQPQFAAASEMMLNVTRELSGTYVPNPLWNEFTHHNLATGHPLGGCVMADSADTGVVNHKGQVFTGADGSGAAHAGLYVMDGSVIPTSLGVNPLLTISALAERSCSLLAQDYGWEIDYQLN